MSLKKCPTCGNSISQNAKACPNCGEPQKKPTSRITIAIAALFVIGIGMSVSRKGDKPVEPAPVEITYPHQGISHEAKELIRMNSKDADSLKLKNEFTAKPGMYCGEVNGKNSFGAYSGFRRFIAQGTTLLIDETGTDTFNQAWQKFCAAPTPT
jgi:predicted nucleic acid-binding Zn ribbon protein